MKYFEMLVYCIIYPILTMSIFLIWYFQTSLTGERIGMAPVLMILVLFVTFLLESFLIFIFRKKINDFKSKAISLFVAFLLYEVILWFFNGQVAIIAAFNQPVSGNLNMAFSLSSILSLLLIFGIMMFKLNRRPKSFSA